MILKILFVCLIYMTTCVYTNAEFVSEIANCYETCSKNYPESQDNRSSCQHGCLLSSSFGIPRNLMNNEKSCKTWCASRISTPEFTPVQPCIAGCTWMTPDVILTLVVESHPIPEIEIDDVLMDPGLRNQFRITDTKIPSTYYTNLPSFFKEHALRRSTRLCRDVWSRWSGLIYFVFVITFFAGVIYGFKMTPTAMFYSPQQFVDERLLIPSNKPPAYTEKSNQVEWNV